MNKKNTIFICTGNSCRSQIAEGLLREKYSDEFNVYSAGSNPSKLHPASISVMEEWGIDISNHKSKTIDKYLNEYMDYVITVCDNAKQSCPSFPNGKHNIHWSIKDPFHSWGNELSDLEPYRKTRDELSKKINEFVTNIKK